MISIEQGGLFLAILGVRMNYEFFTLLIPHSIPLSSLIDTFTNFTSECLEALWVLSSNILLSSLQALLLQLHQDNTSRIQEQCYSFV
mmetsp:Transcript_17299/g.25836  ORF Transcript_17299/g.25836 Transcript_17299/m.25836 type:complete len:87 (+) Transcript_17299:445-705(+)